MRKKGFTLVELLAVIIVLAAISLIVVPGVLTPIRNSEQRSFKVSVQGILDSVRIDTADDKYQVPRLYYYKDGSLTLLKVNNVPTEREVKTEGRLMAEGYIYVLGDGSIVTDNIEGKKYCGYNSISDNMIIVQKNEGDCPEANLFSPTIVLKGESPIYIGIGEVYLDPGVDARTVAGDPLEYTYRIFQSGKEVGKVDTSYETEYVIRYTTSNGDETASIDRIVKVIDMTPLITITPPDSLYVKKKEVEITAQAIQPNVLQEATYQINGGEKTSFDKNSSVLLDQDGEYTIIVAVIDDHGHTNQVVSGPYKIDTISPVITVPDKTEVAVTDVSSFDLMKDVEVTDNHIETVTVTTNGELGAIPGDYSITYTATDEAGNSTSVTRIISVIEKDGPILSFQPSQTSGWVTGVDVSLSATDDSDIKSFAYKVYQNDSFQESGTISGSGNRFSGQVSFQASGRYQIELNASDIYNNLSSITSGIYYIDSVKPSISGANNVSIIKDTSFDVMSGVSATDDMSGVVSFTARPTTVDVTKAGVTTITYTAVDGAMNTTTVTRTVTVTTEPPTAQFAVVGRPFNSNGWANANFNVTITGVDHSGLGIKQLKWCNGNADSCTPITNATGASTTVPVSVEGTNSRICVIVTDNNNVSSGTICTDPYKLDKKAPTITAKNSTATVMEQTSQVIATTYFTTNKNGFADITGTSCIDTSNSNASVTNTSSLAVGNHTIQCTVNKANGKSASASFTLTIQEAIASIGTTLYPSLNSAVSAVTNSTATTIKILKNYTQSSSVTIPASRNITIDLNGKTITSTVTSRMIVNNSNLEMKTSVTGGKITSASGGLFSNGTGTLKITSGTYSSTGSSYQLIYTSSAGTIQVNGGTFESTGNTIYSSSSGKVNIAGGTLTATSNSTSVYMSSGVLTATGGTISSVSGNALYGGSSSTINVQGATIKGGTAWAIYINGTLNVTKGNISGEKAVYIYNGTGSFTGGIITASKYSTIEIDGTGTATIDGATIKSTAGKQDDGYYAAVRVYGTSTITMKSGSISGDSNILVAADGSGKITVTGGTVSTGSDVVMIANYSDTSVIDLQGGTFKRTNQGAILWNAKSGTAYVKGGTYTSAGNGFTQGSRNADTTGTIQVTGGNITVQNGSVFHVADAGTINVSGVTVVSTSPVQSGKYYYSVFSVGGCTDTIPSYGKGTINVSSGTFSTTTTMLGGVHENAKLNITGGTFTTTQDADAFVIYTGGTFNMTGGTIQAKGGDTAIGTYTNGIWANCYTTSTATITIGNKSAALSTTSPLVYSTDEYGVYAKIGTFNFYNGKIAGSTSKAAYYTSGTTFNTRGSVSSSTQTIDGYSLNARYFTS